MSNNPIIEYATSQAQFKARQLVNRNGFIRCDLKDIQQELLTAVVEGLPKFNGDLAGAKTFVCLLINNRIASLIRYRKAQRRTPDREACSLDDWTRDMDGAWVRREAITEEYPLRSHQFVSGISRQDQVELEMDVVSVMASLPEDLRDLCERLKTQSVLKISRETGISVASVYRNIKTLREKFKAMGLDGAMA